MVSDVTVKVKTINKCILSTLCHVFASQLGGDVHVASIPILNASDPAHVLQVTNRKSKYTWRVREAFTLLTLHLLYVTKLLEGKVLGMEEERLEIILVSLGLLLFGSYHVWLLYTILRNPFRTVIGLNAESRHQWVLSMMNDPLKNGVLAVQTIRNNIMASTLLATTALTLSSIIGIFASSTWNSDVSAASISVHGNKTSTSSIKRLSISICFLVAFLCNVQSIRYYAHVSFLITAPALRGKKDFMEYTAKVLNRGSHSWSLGLRAFYLSFPLFLWIYGPIAMFACCCLIESEGLTSVEPEYCLLPGHI